VSKRKVRPAVAGVMMTVLAGTTLAAEEAPGQVPIGQDLAAVIALQGLPCGKVVSARQQGPDDYVATCQDGNRYRVYVNADGRVVVAKVD
jgi:hypothetical protein